MGWVSPAGASAWIFPISSLMTDWGARSGLCGVLTVLKVDVPPHLSQRH